MTTGKSKNGASVAVFDGDHVLLALRGKEPMKGHWSLPGGAIEPGEQPLEAAKRELEEETGLQAFDLVAVTAFHPHRLVKGKLVESDLVIHVFATRNYSGLAEACDDAADLKWVQWDRTGGLKTTPGAAEILRLARKALLTET